MTTDHFHTLRPLTALLCLMLLGMGALAQSPPQFNGLTFQAIAKDDQGDPLTGQTISLRLRVSRAILTTLYEEDQTVTTNDHGLFTVILGDGVPNPGAEVTAFENIDWTQPAIHALVVFADLSGGSNYTFLSSQTIRSVPFAHYARTADRVGDSTWVADLGQSIVLSRPGYNVGIGTSTPHALLEVDGDLVVSELHLGSDAANVAFSSGVFGVPSGDYNTAFGRSALQNRSSGNYNSSLGDRAMINTFSGSNNAAVGGLALRHNTIGNTNTALGFTAMEIADSIALNTAMGAHASQAIQFTTLHVGTVVVDKKNTAIGSEALRWCKEGYNAAIGKHVLGATSNTARSVGIGANAMLFGNDWNVAIGSNVMGGVSTLTGSGLVAVGARAMFNSRYGANTAIGVEALYNSAARDNVGLGWSTLKLNENGQGNAAFGSEALMNIEGTGNTGVGHQTGSTTMFFGNYNTFLGWNSTVTGSGPFSYSTAIGEFATVAAIDQIRVGTNLSSSIGGYQAWTNLSDGRFKNDVVEDVPGLDLIMKLRPVTYELDHEAIIDHDHSGESAATRKKFIAGRVKNVRHTGFVAQEVEAVLAELGAEFSGLDTPNGERDKYGLRYGMFVMPLIKAIQQQQVTIHRQRHELERRREQLDRLCLTK